MIFVPSLATSNVAPPVAEAPTPPPVVPAVSPIISSVAPVVPPAPPTPSIKGKLIWYHNVWDSTAPDAGARVWLLTADDVATLAGAAGGTATEPVPAKAAGWDAKFSSTYKFPVAVANERGEFFFDRVPPGAYVLVIKSVRCYWATPRDRDGKLRFKPVEVRPGAPVDFTLDLGRTPDAFK